MILKKHAFILVLTFFFPVLAFSQGVISRPALIKIGIAQTLSSPDFDEDARGFEKALTEAGFQEGIHVAYIRQNAQGDVARARAIAHRLFNTDMKLIHSIGTPATRAVIKVIRDVPIVFSSVTDPVYAGLLSKKYPLGTKTEKNVTGVSDQWPVSLQFEMYTHFFTKANKWGTIYNQNDVRSSPYIKELRETAEKLKVELIEATVSGPEEVLPAVQFLAGKVQAVYITYDHTALASFDVIVKVCDEKKIPLFGGDLNSVLNGAMAAYGWDYFQIGYAAGKKAVRILKGEKPGDIPWDLGEKMVLLVNEKAAKAQGAIIPPALFKTAKKVVAK